MNLFPLISAPDVAELNGIGELPLAREVAWDFDTDTPVWRNGQPVFVTGAAAVAVWAYNAIKTDRACHDVFSLHYGQGLAELVGRPYSADVRTSESVRHIKEALQQNPYITSVDNVDVSFEGSTLTLSIEITTLYGEVKINDIHIAF